jgi:hypothetical protein
MPHVESKTFTLDIFCGCIRKNDLDPEWINTEKCEVPKTIFY